MTKFTNRASLTLRKSEADFLFREPGYNGGVPSGSETAAIKNK